VFKVYRRLGESVPGHQGGEQGGASAARFRKLSNYAIQLREKQKIRFTYGLMERQFRNLYEKASRQRGNTGENMMVLLESRLDNIVFRLGMAPSLRAARQLVSHCHFEVNGEAVNIPSYTLKPGDTVRVRDKSPMRKDADSIVHNAMRRLREGELVSYLMLDKAKMEGTYVSQPRREEIPVVCKEQLVVEFYSR
jgi:small subunit ribosomal protein S4